MNFRGDLTDISAKQAALELSVSDCLWIASHRLCAVCFRSLNKVNCFSNTIIHTQNLKIMKMYFLGWPNRCGSEKRTSGCHSGGSGQQHPRRNSMHHAVEIYSEREGFVTMGTLEQSQRLWNGRSNTQRGTRFKLSHWRQDGRRSMYHGQCFCFLFRFKMKMNTVWILWS